MMFSKFKKFVSTAIKVVKKAIEILQFALAILDTLFIYV